MPSAGSPSAPSSGSKGETPGASTGATGETAAAPGEAPKPAGPPPAPPSGIRASDKPSDEGKTIVVRWSLSPDDGAGNRRVIGYEVLRGSSPSGPFEVTPTKAVAGKTEAEDSVPANRTDYYYVVRAMTPDSHADSSPSAAPAQARPQWFKTDKSNILIWAIVFCATTLITVQMSRRGTNFYIRPLGGINAIDEAIGRATEMGKPILFVPGLHEAGDVPTIAALSILGRVAKKVAEYQSRLIVPCYYSMVMVVAREVVKSAYTEAGRPDAYREQDVFYVTQEQFAYVAAINGIMLRERPATNFYLGAFFAESLVLAETGFQAGSIQIAGTDQPIQIPFFVAACDYTLIGEELYAAAAYLSNEPKQKATLKAQDFGKGLALALIALVVVLWVVWPFRAAWLASVVGDGTALWSWVTGLFGMGAA